MVLSIERTTVLFAQRYSYGLAHRIIEHLEQAVRIHVQVEGKPYS